MINLLFRKILPYSFFFSSSSRKKRELEELELEKKNQLEQKLQMEIESIRTGLQIINKQVSGIKYLTNKINEYDRVENIRCNASLDILKIAIDNRETLLHIQNTLLKKEQHSVAPPLLSRLAALLSSGGPLSLGIIILFMGSFYVLFMFLFYKFIHLGAWLFSIGPFFEETAAVLSPEVQPLPTLPPESVPTEIGATDKQEAKPASQTQNPSFFYWAAVVSIASIVAFFIHRVMVKGPKIPGTSDKEVEGSDRSRSLEIIQNLPNVPHVHQETQTIEPHRADSSCQTGPSFEEASTSTQTGPPLNPISEDMAEDLSRRYEKLRHELQDQQSRHELAEAKTYSDMVRYQVDSQQRESFITDLGLTQTFERWRSNILEGFYSLRDKFGSSSSRPESSGVKDQSKDSIPPGTSKPPGPTPTSSEGGESGSGD